MKGLKNFTRKSIHVFATGRMNPVTSGHELLADTVLSLAKQHNAGHTVLVTGSRDPKKNPLSQEEKLKHIRRAFPTLNTQPATKEAPSLVHHIRKLSTSGVKHLILVTGADRSEQYRNMLHKYNGKDWNFDHITVHSIDRPEGAMSATSLRGHAKAGNYSKFESGLPSRIKANSRHAKSLYKALRKGMAT